MCAFFFLTWVLFTSPSQAHDLFLPFCQMCRCESLIVIEDTVGISRRHSTAERRSMKCQLVSLGMWRFLSLFFQVNSFVSGLHQSSASLQFEGAPSILRIGLSPFMIDPSHFTWDSFSSNFRIGFQDTSRLSKAHICHISAGHGMPWLR